ncbi:hypothetical protein ACPOM7_19040 [Peribacillus castrilensis]|uniref:hypothetical protein n=1 Tax=Peribacillus TaxID=2675229 RepID=UPI0030F63E01
MTDVNVNFPPTVSPNRVVTAGDVESMVTQVKADVEGQVSVVSAQLADKVNLTNKKINVLNERTGDISAVDIANFSGQGLPRTEAPIGFVFHHYTDGEMMRLDNVGDSPVLTLKNARNDSRRNDKPVGYVGNGNFLECRKQHDTGTYNLFTVGNDGDLRWFDNGGSSKVKLYNLKTPIANEYAFELVPYNANTKLLNLMSANNVSALLISIDGSNYVQVTTTSNNAGIKYTPTGNFWVKPTNGSVLLEADTFVRKNSVNYKVQTARSGTTANRPTDYIVGESYFDTTLGKPIWCKTVAPVVWVDAMGATV